MQERQLSNEPASSGPAAASDPPPVQAQPRLCSYVGCEQVAWADSPAGRCLCHSPQNGASSETARTVWETARRKAADPAGCSFAGWHFPADPDERLFTATVFAGDAVFHGAAFAAQTGFLAARFTGAALFDNAVFHGDVWFIDADFAGDVRFHGVRFQGDADFEGAFFHAGAWFGNCSFQDGRDIQVDLPSVELPLVAPHPFQRRQEGETAYRLAKQAAVARGDYRRAGHYHYAEQAAHEYGNRVRCGMRPWRLRFWICMLELIFARVVFGYGEKPQRALLAGVGLIVAMALLYFTVSGIAPSSLSLAEQAGYRPSLGECIHFSAVTFTTIGYGDLVPKSSIRLLADAEGFLGAALMALFVVGLARLYMR